MIYPAHFLFHISGESGEEVYDYYHGPEVLLPGTKGKVFQRRHSGGKGVIGGLKRIIFHHQKQPPTKIKTVPGL